MNIWQAKYLWAVLAILKTTLSEEEKKSNIGDLGQENFLNDPAAEKKYWTELIVPNTVPRYEILMWPTWKILGNTSYSACEGTVLNDRYILVHTRCFFQKRYMLERLEVVKLYFKRVFGSSALLPADSDKEITDFVLWTFSLITLIRLKTPLIYDNFTRCINLPTTEKLMSWQDPYFLPNDVEVSSSLRCDSSRKYLHLFTKGNRYCSHDIKEKTSKLLIPSCLIHQPSKNAKDCWFFEGSPLVYNNTLLGIRNHFGSTPSSPFNSIKYDLYLNLIPYVPIIQAYMEDYNPCPF